MLKSLRDISPLGFLSFLARREALILPLLAAGPAYWVWQETAIWTLAFLLPLMLIAQILWQWREDDRQASLALRERPAFLRGRPISPREAAEQSVSSACLVIQLDDIDGLLRRYGKSGLSELQVKLLDRLRQVLRGEDFLDHLGAGVLVAVLSPNRKLELDVLVQMALRLQEAVARPLRLGALQVQLSCSIGFCSASFAAYEAGCDLLEAAQEAADEALRNGPNGIRAWAPDLTQRRDTRDAQREELQRAFVMSEIEPHFQPQINARSGALTGVEALARWNHPLRGLLGPAEFLGWVEANDMYDRLGATMLDQSLAALVKWDRAGLHVPSVSVNFSSVELRNPLFLNTVKQALARYQLTAERLTIEILETVIVENDDDVVVSNIAKLADFGCGIDLDDFGTGHASIAAIRRFIVRRLKIDRSFVTRVDHDPSQQKMVAAIISLAERLELETLAEGVETEDEFATLVSLNCGHVQGYGIARPMPADQLEAWLAERSGQRANIVEIASIRA